MREGGAWAEGLMDCGDGPAPAAAQPPLADPLQALAALSRRQQAQELRERALAAPAVRAALAHPGHPPGAALLHHGPTMVPVGGAAPRPLPLTCAAGLAGGAEGDWQQAPAPPPFFGAPPVPWFVGMPQAQHPAALPFGFFPGTASAGMAVPQLAGGAAYQQAEPHASGSGSGGVSDGTTLRLRSSFDSASGGSSRHAPKRQLGALQWGQPPAPEGEDCCDAPSDGSDVEDGGLGRQHSQTQAGAAHRPGPNCDMLWLGLACRVFIVLPACITCSLLCPPAPPL